MAILSLGAACGLASCASYEAQPLDPAEMARASRGLDWDEARTKIALERLENTRLFPAREVLFTPEDGLTFKEAFVAALALSPLLEQRRQELKGRESLLLSVSGIESVRVGGNDDGPRDARRGKIHLLFDPVSLFGAGKVAAAEDRADAELGRSMARLHEAEWDVFRALKAGFLLVDRIESTQRAFDALQQEFDAGLQAIATPLHELGRIPRDDWNRVRVIEDLLAIRREELKREHETATNRLKETIGLQPGEPVVFVVSPTDSTDAPWDAERLEASALDRRWDLQILLAEYQVSEENLRYEVASQYPDILIGPIFRFGKGGEVFGGALQLDVPNPWTATARIDAASAERSRIRHRVEEKLLAIQHEIRNSILVLLQKTSTASTWRERTLPRVHEISEIARTTVKLNPDALDGAVSRFRDLIRATEAYWKEEQDRRDALIDLERAAGYPLTPVN